MKRIFIFSDISFWNLYSFTFRQIYRFLFLISLFSLFSVHKFSYNHFTVWFLRLNSIYKLFFSEFSISIKIQSSQNSSYFRVICFVSIISKKTVQVFRVNETVTPVINCQVAFIAREFSLASKFLSKIFTLFMYLNLHLNQLGHIPFHIQCQVIKLIYIHIRSLSSFRSQLSIITWQDHLHKIWIIQLPIFIRVKELNYIVTISFCDSIYLIISQEIQEFY